MLLVCMPGQSNQQGVPEARAVAYLSCHLATIPIGHRDVQHQHVWQIGEGHLKGSCSIVGRPNVMPPQLHEPGQKVGRDLIVIGNQHAKRASTGGNHPLRSLAPLRGLGAFGHHRILTFPCHRGASVSQQGVLSEAKRKKSRRGGTPSAVFDHVGLLINEPPGRAELPFA
jgi:hypothetical protein